MSQNLQELSRAGVSIWLDDLSRERIETGNLAQLMADSSVVGVTTNPSIFRLDQYGHVMEAYVRGLEEAAANGHDLATIQSVASFFVSRVDTEIDARLGEAGAALAGKAGIANARLAFKAFEEFFAGDR